jgi:hypothetical protein
LFKDAYECGYLEGDVTEEWSVPRLVNWTYNSFNEEFYSELAWDEFGLHLPALTLDSTYWPPCNLRRADFLHRQALRANREQVRTYREQGKSFVEAQQLALAASTP